MADIDLSQIEAQIAELSPEQLREQLTQIKTRQKVAQKKYYNPERAKLQRAAAAAKLKALEAAARAAGIYDEIEAAAKAAADAKLAEEEAEQESAEA